MVFKGSLQVELNQDKEDWKRTMFGRGYYWKEYKRYLAWILLSSGVMIALRYLENEAIAFIVYTIYLLVSTSWLFITNNR